MSSIVLGRKVTHDKPFQESKSLALRRQEAKDINLKYPEKVPMIVERHHKEKFLPRLDKCKFLVPREMTASQFIYLLRSKMQLSPNKTFYLVINKKTIPCPTSTLAELYKELRDKDGFLYTTYSSQEMFG